VGIAKYLETCQARQAMSGESARTRLFFETSSRRQIFGEMVSPCQGELAFISVLPVGCLVLFAVPGWKFNLCHEYFGGNRPLRTWQEKSCQESRPFISVVGASLMLVTGVAAQPDGWLGFQKVGRQPDKSVLTPTGQRLTRPVCRASSPGARWIWQSARTARPRR
jgi:hypothetical protein